MSLQYLKYLLLERRLGRDELWTLSIVLFVSGALSWLLSLIVRWHRGE